MQEKINSLELCMQKLTTTLQFVEKNQTEIKQTQKEYIKSNEEQHREIMDKMDAWIDHANLTYVNKTEFQPIKAFVYGMAGFVLLSVLGAVISLVFIKLS